jgi:YVTN family beta-propeller protein
MVTTTLATLKLDYAFVPGPNPIRASAAGANPSTIDLQVIASDPLLSSVKMHQILIEIPVGEDTARSLSSSPNLPPPTYDTTGPWTISSAGSTVTITARSKDPQAVNQPIVFTLPGIVVSETEGTVPLTITEMNPPAPKVVDGETYTLLKQPADFPVTRFSADPAILSDLDQPVTLYWSVSDQGKHLSYGLRIVSVGRAMHLAQGAVDDGATGARNALLVTLKDCVSDGNCYSWQDGQQGVRAPVVNQTTTFALDVVQVIDVGHRSVIASLTTTVQVIMPMISQNSYIESKFSGRVLQLRWLAFNAKSCTVEVDGASIDDNAPADTYANGYLWVPPNQDGPRTLSVIAHATVGTAQASFTFPPQRVTPITKIGFGGDPGAVAMSHSGTFALVANPIPSFPPLYAFATAIDVAGRKVEATTAQFKGLSVGIAITPDDSLALVANVMGGEAENGDVRVIDLSGLKVEPAVLSVLGAWAIAITPDGNTALVTSDQAQAVVAIDIVHRTVEKTIQLGKSTLGIAITPSGELAFVTNSNEGTVTVVDVTKRVAEPGSIKVGGKPFAVAITPDGTLALVANQADNTVSVIDIASRTAEARVIHTGATPMWISISPDGTLALTADNGGSLTVIDIARRTGVSIPWDGQPTSVGITRDSMSAVVVSPNNVAGYLGLM